LTVFYTVTGTAAAGLDYAALPGSATFPAGETEATVTVSPIDDELLEGHESGVLRFDAGPGNKVGALSQATITIQDDERPAVTVAVSDGTATEAGPDTGAFLIERTGPTTAALTVFFSLSGAASEGADYQSLRGSVTIPAGAPSATVTVVPVDDASVEGAESVILGLDSYADYVVAVPGIAAFQIADDDLGAVTIEATDALASEAGLDPGLFTLRRTGDPSAALTVFLSFGLRPTRGSPKRAALRLGQP
jgi:hypothetical protein